MLQFEGQQGQHVQQPRVMAAMSMIIHFSQPLPTLFPHFLPNAPHPGLCLALHVAAGCLHREHQVSQVMVVLPLLECVTALTGDL